MRRVSQTSEAGLGGPAVPCLCIHIPYAILTPLHCIMVLLKLSSSKLPLVILGPMTISAIWLTLNKHLSV